jgi:phosphoribosylcarboxyaminoimidazole (NCAIR) mutase
VPDDLTHPPITTPAAVGSQSVFRSARARAEALPELFAARVRPEDLDGMRSMAGAGEWQELVDLLVASLGVTGTPVTVAERDELRSLLAAMDMPDNGLAGLTVEV